MKGWLVGKTPMRDWKAACRNAEKWDRWEREAAQKAQERPWTRDPATGKWYQEGQQ